MEQESEEDDIFVQNDDSEDVLVNESEDSILVDDELYLKEDVVEHGGNAFFNQEEGEDEIQFKEDEGEEEQFDEDSDFGAEAFQDLEVRTTEDISQEGIRTNPNPDRRKLYAHFPGAHLHKRTQTTHSTHTPHHTHTHSLSLYTKQPPAKVLSLFCLCLLTSINNDKDR